MRNRVIEIRRFAKVEEWYYVDSANTIADIDTRKRSSIKDIEEDSEWMQGFTRISRVPPAIIPVAMSLSAK